METVTPIPPELARGAVRARHIVFLYAVIFATMSIASFRLGSHADPAIRNAFRGVLGQVMMAALIVPLSLIVPELRRSLPTLYGRSHGKLAASDILLFIAAMLTWSFGAHRMLVIFPLLRWRPELFSFFGYYQHFPEVGPTHVILLLVATVIVAPMIEELMFRGYLLNLLRARYRLWPAILLSSFIFGLVHMQAAIFAAFVGIFLALIYLRFGSLWPGTFLHGLYNLCFSPFGLSPFFLEKSKAEIGLWTSWIPEIVLSIAFVPLVYLLWRRFRPAS